MGAPRLSQAARVLCAHCYRHEWKRGYERLPQRHSRPTPRDFSATLAAEHAASRGRVAPLPRDAGSAMPFESFI